MQGFLRDFSDRFSGDTLLQHTHTRSCSPSARFNMTSCSAALSPRSSVCTVPTSQGTACPENSTSRTRGRMPPKGDSSQAHTPSRLDSHRSMASRKRSVMANMGWLRLTDRSSPCGPEQLEVRRRTWVDSEKEEEEDARPPHALPRQLLRLDGGEDISAVGLRARLDDASLSSTGRASRKLLSESRSPVHWRAAVGHVAALFLTGKQSVRLSCSRLRRRGCRRWAGFARGGNYLCPSISPVTLTHVGV